MFLLLAMIYSKFISCLPKLFSFDSYFLFRTPILKLNKSTKNEVLDTAYGWNKSTENVPIFSAEELSAVTDSVCQLTASNSDVCREINLLLLQTSTSDSKFKELYCSQYPRTAEDSVPVLYTKKTKSPSLPSINPLTFSTVLYKTMSEDAAVRKLCEKAIKTCVQVRQMIDLYKNEKCEEFTVNSSNFKRLSLQQMKNQKAASDNLIVYDNPASHSRSYSSITERTTKMIIQNQVSKLEETLVEGNRLENKPLTYKKSTSVVPKNECLYCSNSPRVPKNYFCPSCKKMLHLCPCIHCPHCRQSRIRFNKKSPSKYKENCDKLNVSKFPKDSNRSQNQFNPKPSVQRRPNKNFPKKVKSQLGTVQELANKNKLPTMISKMLKNSTSPSTTSSLTLPWNSSNNLSANLGNIRTKNKVHLNSSCKKDEKDSASEVPDVFRKSQPSEIEERDKYFGDCYKNSEYHRTNTFTYYTAEDYMRQFRQPQPSSKKKQ